MYAGGAIEALAAIRADAHQFPRDRGLLIADYGLYLDEGGSHTIGSNPFYVVTKVVQKITSTQL